MKNLKLMMICAKLGAMNDMEYRENFLIHLAESFAALATGISVLWVVYSQTDTIGGWTWNEILVVLGLYYFFSGLVNMVLAPSIRQFMNQVWDGTLDFALVKPFDHQFVLSVQKVMIFQLVDVCTGLVVLVGALIALGADVTLERAAMFAVFLAAGAAILYAFWVALGTIAVWTVKIENVLLIFYSMFEAGRWPVGIYPDWLRYSLTYVVPIAFAITSPAEAVLGKLTWMNALSTSCIAIVATLAARAFWNFGVQRHYQGASA
ncbi:MULTISPECIES: ABC transporter permease [Bradyrhizobium]|uniref:ABC transporter permease n=1 Tax=Bradyrhizobium TaxID=374 RepID=UPI00041C5CD2|nr:MULTISPECIES: ABC-2 family transporter protein [Bradyrhizobium]MBR1001963.1 ABC-2 family transporter protein [Bradyrhizobium liaoningense]MCP1749191.1 ABC-2 type transport system permease protein [Bradyrhizobium japonicum]MCP1855157.1 ABC-2 type transport system permease protein [Bradyrhizobium japonicum]MCP1898094.1 ABC-2 type transport system permease protein [Bradyrhizobium japonicum]MCW2330973.1 ABC-2 type transport system permease protein [Bradyrhizobium japonicum]